MNSSKDICPCLINFIKIVSLFSLLFFLSLKIFQCVEKYNERPLYLSSNFVNQKKAGFTALTICPNAIYENGVYYGQPGYKFNILQKHGISNTKNYNIQSSKSIDVDLNWTSNNSKISQLELFDEVTYKVHELVQRVKISTLSLNEVSM